MAESNSSAIPTDEVASRRVGTVVKGKWTIDALLGTGGMASVYAATHRNGQRAALKIMHTIFARDRDVVERFLREGYVANKIGHSACVRAIDDDVTDDGEPFLVMELLEGETLRDLWKRTGKRVPLPLVMHIAERLLDCLAACHAAGVIHRDLKPANIYVTTAGDVKVLDFGVALMKDVTAATAGMALGTPAYMSPEQAKGLADKIDHRVDIFSVGAVIHALASGKRVHRAKHEQDALKLAATTPAPSVATIAPDLPPRVVALVDRALAWEPSERFADAREMQAEVIEIEKELKASASRPVPATTLETFHDDDEPMEILAEDHPRTFRSRGATRALGEAIDATRAYGRHDPEARSAMDRAFEVLADALAQDRAVVVEVRQAAFYTMGHLAWVPSPGGDRVPRELYAAGVRALAFTRGVGIEEVVGVVALLGDSSELPADHDVAAALWDLGLVHVRARGVSGFLSSDAQGRERRTTALAELEAALGTAQRKYALRLANPNLRAPKIAGPLSLDTDTRARLETELVLGEEELVDRHTDLMTAAILDAAKHGEVPAVLGALRRWAIRAMSMGQHGKVMQAARALCGKLAHAVGPKDAPKLEGAVMSAAFGKEALVAALSNLDDASRGAMAPVLSKLTEADWPVIATALCKPMSERSATILLESAERVARSKTTELAAATQKAPAPARRAVRAWLVKEGHRDAAASIPATKPGEHALVPVEPSPEESLVVALAALAKLASNKQQSSAEYERKVGDAAGALARMPKQSTTIQLEIAQAAVYVDGKLARLSQPAYTAAMELAGLLAKESARIVSLPRAATADDLRRFGADVAASTSTSAIKRSSMSDVARTYGADLPHLTLEQRLVASDGAFTLALEEVMGATKAGPRPETPALARAARAIVDDSVGTTAALMGLATHAPDALTTKVAAAIVALAAAREITHDRRTLAAIVAGAAMSELPRPAMLVGLGNADPTSASGVIAWEAARALTEAEPPHVSFAAELVAAATRWVDLRATQSYDEAIRELANDARLSPFALRAICACTGVIPSGTLVELSDGETAEVIAANEEDGARPHVRLLADPRRTIELEQEDELVIARVVEIDGWKTGPTITTEVEAQRPADESKSEGDERSLKAHSIVRESAQNEPAPTAEGKLATTPLLHVLVYVLDRALSGTLEFRESDGTRHRISLAHGAPTRVVTGRLIAPLGAQLVADGKLTDAQAASAITNAKAEGLPLGRYLVTAGKLSDVDLQRALEVQVRRKLAGLANLPEDATYAFYKDADRLEPAPSIHQLHVDPLDVILEGVRAWTQRDRIRETLARYAQLPITLHAEATPEAMDLSEGERSVLARLRKEPQTLAALLKHPPMDVDALMSLVYTLVITRQVVVPGQVKGPLGVKPSKVHTPAVSRVSKERTTPAVDGGPSAQHPATRSPSPGPAAARPLAAPINAPPNPSPAPKVPRVKREDTMKEIARIEQHLSRKDIPLAARVAGHAITQDATDPDLNALNLWVKALSKTLKPAEVIEQLGVILLDFPDCTRARLFRAKLYKRDNAKLREAVADFEQVLVDDPSNKDAAAEVRLLRLMVKPGRL